ncbi:guanitoxin biosynthesis heme-dependent pre-guanitoxin N-hydroxylase GntA [Mesonia ostreae]|uniref:Guanitoxin biosynthesis heme-dependent pre-guanitoxin N-hydroxylase GntA n=1 Tax=Mesonia ostreae TaxID=861110 RepID=A0ABU2KE89_9FLAO|nr:guanitoxin biosynthesis heme-dependent pre-guanitoxin N-hydroxylase GntA [Mesonia ostreae]MDT0293024.1 guanitoxin biosynthesis heme-dependent pre-guanitoxin N-hydroxylase GntA [Mesonia ostreae]
MMIDSIDNKNDIVSMVRDFILDDHPCVMAQSVIADDNVTIESYGTMQGFCPNNLLNDLKEYVADVEENSMKFQSFIATFEDSHFETEKDFENALWKLLHTLHSIDTHPWDKTTSPDTTSSKFSFSLLGTSFYIVGMHPNSSRFARSSPFPMIVFNLHSQFELLRSVGRYSRVRDLIRKRDKAFQGSVNPMLEDFGTNSEARQYSGRAVEDDWKCPYNFKSE